MPRRTAAYLQQFADEWSTPRRARVARGLVGGRPRRPATCSRRCSASQPGTISMHQNVTVAHGDHRVVLTVRRAAQPDRDDRPRVSVEHVPVRGVPPLRRRDRLRASRRTRCGRTSSALLDAIDERTVLVPLSLRAVQERLHPGRARRSSRRRTASARASSSTCTRRPARCRWRSSGSGADFAVGGSVKWLCGGPGAGYLYVRPDLADAARAGHRRLGGARAARSSSRPAPIEYADAPGAVPERHAERPVAVFGARRLRDRRARSACRRSARSRCG